MKPRPIYRFVFAIIVTVGTILFLHGARKVSNENLQARINCKQTNLQETVTSNNDFIFFESVTKFLIISLIK